MTQLLCSEGRGRLSFFDTLASTLAADLNPAPATPSVESRDLALLIRALRGIEEQLPGAVQTVLHEAKAVSGQRLSQSADFKDLGRQMMAGVTAFAATYALHARSLSGLDADRTEFDGYSAVLLNDARLVSASNKALLRPVLLVSAKEIYSHIADEAIRDRIAAGTVKEGLQQYRRTLPISVAERDRGLTVRAPKAQEREAVMVAPQIESHNPGGIMMERLR